MAVKAILKISLAIALGWCALSEVGVAFVSKVFGFRMDGDWILVLGASSPSEISEFFRLYSTEVTVAAVAVLSLWLAILAVSCFLKGKWFWLFVAIVLGYVGWNCRTVSLARTWPPVFMAYDTLCRSAQYLELGKAGAWTGDTLPEYAGRDRQTVSNVVFVIGESMTTDRMSLYGYGKPTTPFLESLRDRATVMDPLRATSRSTIPALRMMLTRATEKSPERAIETLAVAFRRRGYRPVLISAQARWGRRCGVGQQLFAACETRTYLADFEAGSAMFDEVLVPYLQREMAVDDDRPFAIFLHLQGSHMDPKYRVPPDFKTPDGFDAYDRSLAYTDRVLEAIFRTLPPKTILVYTSDHGESPDSPSWRDVRSPSLWRVPFIVWPKMDGGKPMDCQDQIFDWLLDRLDSAVTGCDGRR